MVQVHADGHRRLLGQGQHDFARQLQRNIGVVRRRMLQNQGHAQRLRGLHRGTGGLQRRAVEAADGHLVLLRVLHERIEVCQHGDDLPSACIFGGSISLHMLVSLYRRTLQSAIAQGRVSAGFLSLLSEILLRFQSKHPMRQAASRRPAFSSEQKNSPGDHPGEWTVMRQDMIPLRAGSCAFRANRISAGSCSPRTGCRSCNPSRP